MHPIAQTDQPEYGDTFGAVSNPYRRPMPDHPRSVTCAFCDFPLLLDDQDDANGSWCSGCGSFSIPTPWIGG